MEAHECICQLVIISSLDVLIINVLRNRVVDVKECNSIPLIVKVVVSKIYIFCSCRSSDIVLYLT